MEAGIAGHGIYIPRYRIRVEEIAKVWGADAASYKRGLGLIEKSVPAPDQDTISMGVEAGKDAIRRAGIEPELIDACYVGSESHPYAVKPSGTVIAEALGSTPEVRCASFEFACKAGTEGMAVCLSEAKAGAIRFGLAIGADTSQGAPGDALEYSTAAGAAAFVIGTSNLVAVLKDMYTFMTDTPDFWRREYQHYPRHGGRFTGEPAYFKHVLGAAKGIMKRNGMAPGDFAHVIFHQPNGKFPLRAGRTLGFRKEQIMAGLLVTTLGNTYSGSSPMGLCAVLDISKPGERILLVSFGSGAGSDAFIFEVTERIEGVKGLGTPARKYLDERKFYIDYGTYAKFRRKILKAD